MNYNSCSCSNIVFEDVYLVHFEIEKEGGGKAIIGKIIWKSNLQILLVMACRGVIRHADKPPVKKVCRLMSYKTRTFLWSFVLITCNYK